MRRKVLKLDCKGTFSSKNLSLDDALSQILKQYVPEAKTVTIFDSCDFSIYGSLRDFKIYSIQQSQLASDAEYEYVKSSKLLNVDCLNFNYLNSGIMLRDKFPETRFSSDVACLPYIQIDNKNFSEHNALIVFDYAMLYTKLRKVLAVVSHLTDSFLSRLNEKYRIILVRCESFTNDSLSIKVIDIEKGTYAVDERLYYDEYKCVIIAMTNE